MSLITSASANTSSCCSQPFVLLRVDHLSTVPQIQFLPRINAYYNDWQLGCVTLQAIKLRHPCFLFCWVQSAGTPYRFIRSHRSFFRLF